MSIFEQVMHAPVARVLGGGVLGGGGLIPFVWMLRSCGLFEQVMHAPCGEGFWGGGGGSGGGVG